MANKKYKLTDGNMWATDGIHDFGQNKTQRTINSEVNSALGGKAPTNHASTATTYGAASTSNYGHVKLSNTTPSMDGTAAVGDSTDVARANHVHPSDTSRVPTSRKVNNKQLSSDITLAASDVGAAPTDHASTATTYGKGTSSNYGHVKISDSLTDTTPAATGGVVPSMKAVSDLNGALNNEKNRVVTLGDSTDITSNANFNTIVNVGNYNVATNDIASTVQNIPYPRAGRLIVEYSIKSGSTAYLRQTYKPYLNTLIYERFSANSGSSWSTWVQISCETGTWTPQIPRIGIASITNAKWSRIGNLVSLTATINMSGAGSSSGNLYIEESSLPFYSDAKTPPQGSFFWQSDLKSHACGASAVNNNVWLADSAVTLNSTNANGTYIILLLTFQLI